MPRRSQPEPLALEVGLRIKHFREAAGMTLEALAWETKTVSKGHLSNLERGLVMPTIATLVDLAAPLGILVADLVINPAGTDREKLLDLSRSLPKGALRRLVREVAAGSAAR